MYHQSGTYLQQVVLGTNVPLFSLSEREAGNCRKKNTFVGAAGRSPLGIVEHNTDSPLPTAGEVYPPLAAPKATRG